MLSLDVCVDVFGKRKEWLKVRHDVQVPGVSLVEERELILARAPEQGAVSLAAPAKIFQAQVFNKEFWLWKESN